MIFSLAYKGIRFGKVSDKSLVCSQVCCAKNSCLAMQGCIAGTKSEAPYLMGLVAVFTSRSYITVHYIHV